jgi:predicted transcriptional regulator
VTKPPLSEPGLGPLESDVMAALWSRGEATVREVHDVLRAKRPIAYTTVMTTMDRLHRKKLLVRTREGNAYRYGPKLDRGGWLQRWARGAIDRLLPNLDPVSVAYFVEEARKSNPDALEALRKALWSKEQR